MTHQYVSNMCYWVIGKGPRLIICENAFVILLQARGNHVRYGADQELGPNKRRTDSEAARLSVKWDRSIHRWNMEIHKMAPVVTKKTQRQIRGKLDIRNRARIVAWCPGSWTKGAGGVQHGFISDFSWGQIWADHPLLPTMPSHNREQSSWQMVSCLKSQRLFPRLGCNRHLFDPQLIAVGIYLVLPTREKMACKYKDKRSWNINWAQLGTFIFFFRLFR